MEDYSKQIEKEQRAKGGFIVILILFLCSSYFLFSELCESATAWKAICFSAGLWVIGIVIYNMKKINDKIEELEEQRKKMEKVLFEKGFECICETLYLNDKESKVMILGKEYEFAQILDCKMTDNLSEINNEEIKGFSSINREEPHIALEIAVDDFKQPNIKLKFTCTNDVKTEEYKKVKKLVDDVYATINIILHKNKDKYLEKGTITKIEHIHVEEKSLDELLEKLSELHKSGVLTDYEFAMKKAELLEKLK